MSVRFVLGVIAVLGTISLGIIDYKQYHQILNDEELALQLSKQINDRGYEQYIAAYYLSNFTDKASPLTDTQINLLHKFQQEKLLEEHYDIFNLTYPSVTDWPKHDEFITLRARIKTLKTQLLNIDYSSMKQREIAQWRKQFIENVSQLQSLNVALNQHLQSHIYSKLTNLLRFNYLSLIVVIVFCSIFFNYEYRRYKNQTLKHLSLLEQKNTLLRQHQKDIKTKNIQLEDERQNLILSELRRKTINQLLPVGVMLVDTDGLIEEVNDETCHLFGFSQSEMIGMPVDSLVPEAKRAGHDKLRKSFEHNSEPRIMAANKSDLSGQRKDGSLVPLEIGLAPVNIGTERFMLATLLNVEERREAMESLKQKNKQMDIALEKLRQSNEQLEQFAFICSHDLQEPVRMVISFSQLLNKKASSQLDEKCLGYLTHITDGAERARDLISDILTFCRLDQLASSFESVDLNELCNQINITLKPALKDQKAEFKWPSDLPEIDGVKSQVFQLMMNIVGNGIKFNRHAHPRVELTLEDDSLNWLIKISDNGIGIDPKYFHKLFQIFGRLNAKSEFPGTGIGLAICKKIVDLHGGSISIESQPNQGTSFIITWPKSLSSSNYPQVNEEK